MKVPLRSTHLFLAASLAASPAFGESTDDALQSAGPRILMAITNNTLTIRKFGVPPSPYSFDTMSEVLEGAIAEIAEGGLSGGRAVRSVAVESITGDADTTRVEYELDLTERCADVMACEGLRGSTTLYADVTSHMDGDIKGGGFAAVLSSHAAKVLGGAGRDLVSADGKKPAHEHEEEEDWSDPRKLGMLDFPFGGIDGSFGGVGSVIIVTPAPTGSPVSAGPTANPTTDGPTNSPTTDRPTAAPTTDGPTNAPTTDEPTNAPTTRGPTNAPTTSGPTNAPTTGRPTGAPTTAGPTSAPTSVHIAIPISSTFTMLNMELPLTPSSEQVVKDTIRDVAEAGIDTASQSVTAINITNVSAAADMGNTSRMLARLQLPSITVEYEFTLEQRCSASCGDQTNGTTVFNNLKSYMTDEVEDGSFTTALQENAEVLDNESEVFKNVTVVGETFEMWIGIVEVTTSTAPAPTPWTIDFLGIVSDFAVSSEDELVMRYEIGKNHTYETFLYEKDCVTNITDITVNTTEVEKRNKNMTHDLLTLSYSFDKAAIANSTIWNTTTDNIEICQVVSLVVPEANGLPKMVIVEDFRKVTIDFDLSVDDFTLDAELGAGTNEAAVGATNVTSFVAACKCGGDDFLCDSGALVPNTQLHVCIKSISADINIKALVSMIIRQNDNKMDVINNGNVEIPSIADMGYIPSKNGVVVSTFVPTNIFNYTAGTSINITGSIDMKLSGSARNLLAGVVGDGAFNADGNGKMPYELSVDLRDGLMVLEEGEWMDSSGAFLDRGYALLGMALLFAPGLW